MNHFTVYKVTNLLDGKIYVGKHVCGCNPCIYMGSGKVLRSAMKKHGAENFKKEILFVFDNEAEMNAKEAELVTEEFCSRDDTYNLCPGGKGGWGYINENGLNYGGIENKRRGGQNLKRELKAKGGRKSGPKTIIHAINAKGMLGKTHTDEWKKKHSTFMKENQSGEKHSQFGTIWITNGTENRKIKKDLDTIPDGWYKGRRMG